MTWRGRQLVKRVMDVLGASILLIVTAPLMVWAALAVYRDSPGPVIFRQTRVGLNGRPFVLLKFRTMRVGADQEWIPPQAHKFADYVFSDVDDGRITAIGQFLRDRAIDELPQLFNVLKGEMSLVGPRPEILEMVALYQPHMHRRHSVRPGLTGLAQVSGRRFLTTGETIEYDLIYCDTWTLKLDCVILCRTAGQLFGNAKAR